jgi:DNA invertase Pin-like site-specific DNA recombinase
MASSGLKPAISLLRHDGRDSPPEILRGQRARIEAFAAQGGYEIAYEFEFRGTSDEALFNSPAFKAMLAQIEAKKTLAVIVATATTFAEDPLVQAVGAVRFRKYGVELLVADGATQPAITTVPDQIVDHVFELSERFEAHLRRMAERRRTKLGPQRRKNYVEMFPEAVSLVKSLHRKSLSDGVRRSLRELSAMLAQQGHLNNAGNPYHPDEIRRMIKGADPLRGAPGTHWDAPTAN